MLIAFLRWFFFKLFLGLLILVLPYRYRWCWYSGYMLGPIPPSSCSLIPIICQLPSQIENKYRLSKKRLFLKGLFQGVGERDYYDRTMGIIAIKRTLWPQNMQVFQGLATGFFFYRKEQASLERARCGEVRWVEVAWISGRLENAFSWGNLILMTGC